MSKNDERSRYMYENKEKDDTLPDKNVGAHLKT